MLYELTEYGGELDTVVLQLGLWGARSLGEQRPEEVFTRDSAILSLYTTFRPEFARGAQISYELHYGPLTIHALVNDGELKVAEGPYPDADLVIEAKGSIKPILTRETSPRDAVERGLVRIIGDTALLEQFVRFFTIPPAPRPTEGLAVR